MDDHLVHVSSKNDDASKLLPELLELIAEHIVSISDFIRFRSVCKSWRKAAAPRKLRPQPPIYQLEHNIFNPDRYFYSFATKQVHRISLPQLVGNKILDSTNGWMLLFDVEKHTLSLHNPVSLAHIHLPPTNYFAHDIGDGHLYYDQFADNFVVLIRPADVETKRWFCKVGDELWSELNMNFDNSDNAVTYHRGKFFAVVSSFLYAVDVSVGSSGQFLPAELLTAITEWPGEYPFHNLTTANGELFLFSECTEVGYSLCRLDSDGQQFKWSNVLFDDFAIFYNYSQQPNMFCVKDFPQFKRNCVYFISFSEDVDEIDGYYVKRQEVVDIMDYEYGTIDIVDCVWEGPADFNMNRMWITLGFQ